VVDHHEDCLQSVALLLRILGHRMIEARNGLEAIRLSYETSPDIVMLELDLPGLSGYELAQRFKNLDTSPIQRPFLMAVTSYGSPQDRERSAAAGIDLHLVKPVDPEKLEQAFSSFLRMKIVPLS
jgi:CheY-like chemotaxis protein